MKGSGEGADGASLCEAFRAPLYLKSSRPLRTLHTLLLAVRCAGVRGVAGAALRVVSLAPLLTRTDAFLWPSFVSSESNRLSSVSGALARRFYRCFRLPRLPCVSSAPPLSPPHHHTEASLCSSELHTYRQRRLLLCRITVVRFPSSFCPPLFARVLFARTLVVVCVPVFARVFVFVFCVFCVSACVFVCLCVCVRLCVCVPLFMSFPAPASLDWRTSDSVRIVNSTRRKELNEKPMHQGQDQRLATKHAGGRNERGSETELSASR